MADTTYFKTSNMVCLLHTGLQSVAAESHSSWYLIVAIRTEHAKQLLLTRPDVKLSEVWVSSGFSTERTFLRNFKAITGMTPSEFKGKND